MHHLLRRSILTRTASRLCAVAGLALGVSVGARADFVINGVYAPTVGGFIYNVNITNNGADDILLASLFQTGLLTTIDMTSAPAGYQTTTSDSAMTTFIDFSPAEGSDSVFGAGQTVQGFTFRSSALLDAPETSALDVLGNSPAGTISVAAAPEPATVALLTPALFAGALLARRRRRP